MWPCVQAGKQAQFAQSMRRGAAQRGAGSQGESRALGAGAGGGRPSVEVSLRAAGRLRLALARRSPPVVPGHGRLVVLVAAHPQCSHPAAEASLHPSVPEEGSNQSEPPGGGAGRLRALGPQPSPEPPTTTTTTGVGRVYPHPGPTVPPCGLLSQWAWWRSCVCMCAPTGPAPSPAPPSPFPTQQGSPQAGPRCLSW